MSLPTVLILGAGYGGIAAANALQGSAHVIVVERKQYQDHCIATPRGLCNADFAKSIVVDLHDALPHAIIINDSVTQVTMTTVQLASGVTLGFDYLVVATGSQHAIRPKASTVADAQAEYQANVAILVRSKHALIVGGGPVAVETAGELAHFYPELKLTLVTSGSKLLDTVS
jgi:NADH dehydrogenase FAD-containing subunit